MDTFQRILLDNLEIRLNNLIDYYKDCKTIGSDDTENLKKALEKLKLITQMITEEDLIDKS